MAIVNMTQAAEMAGIGRSTLWRKAKAGVLSTTKFPDGSPGIDTAELFRVFPRETDIEAQVIHEETAAELLKQKQVDALQAMAQEVAYLKEQLQDYRQREQRLLDQVDTLASTIKLIEHRPEPAPAAPAPVRRSWWKLW